MNKIFSPHLFFSFLFWPLLPIHCRCRGLLSHLITPNDTRKDSSGREFGPTQWTLPDNTHHTQETFMLTAGCESAIPAGKRPQTYALDLAATGISSVTSIQHNSARYHSTSERLFIKSSTTINILLGNYAY